MEYVEILRARRVLIIFGGLLVLGLVVEAITWHFSTGHNQSNGTERFSSLVGVGAFGAVIIATFVVSGLNAEAAHTGALIWTRPASRDVIAWRFVAVDAAAIAIGYVMLLVAMIAGVAVVGALGSIVFDRPESARAFAIGLGGAFMWYGIVSLTAARLPGRGPLLAGLSWAVFPIMAGMTQANLVDWLHALIVAVNFANPFAWLGGMTEHGNTSFIPLSPWARVAGEWLIAVAAVAASVRLWATREA